MKNKKKKIYHSPLFEVYGSISKMTLAGTGPTSELNPGGNCPGGAKDPNEIRC
jgi:hypothetical protein